MFLFGPAAQLFFRRGAGSLAILCLWFSAGVVLHHTDHGYAPGSHGQTLSARHTAQTPSDDPCAACEWEKAVPTLPITAAAPAFRPMSFPTDAAALVRTPLLRAFDHFGLRAPPLA